MTKSELVDKLAEETGITKTEAAKVIESFTEGIIQGLQKDDGKVTLLGFGTFSKVHREARIGRNPQTGGEIKIEARNVVKFSPGKRLKESV